MTVPGDYYTNGDDGDYDDNHIVYGDCDSNGDDFDNDASDYHGDYCDSNGDNDIDDGDDNFVPGDYDSDGDNDIAVMGIILLFFVIMIAVVIMVNNLNMHFGNYIVHGDYNDIENGDNIVHDYM